MTDPKSPSAEMLSPLYAMFAVLIQDQEPKEEAEDAEDYETTLTFTYDTDRDMIGIETTYSHDIQQYDDIIAMPDCFQMMTIIVTEFLERIGAITIDGEVDEEFIDREGVGRTPAPTPAPTKH